MKQFNDEYLDDISYIKDIRHLPMGPWHQYDVLLDAQGYGWDYMLDSADYMASADVKCITEVQTGDFRVNTVNITDSYHEHDNKCRETPELKKEQGFLSIAGNSEAIKAPVKIVWVNQTRAIRILTIVEDELLIRKYVETVIRRSFGSEDAMKLGKSASKDQSGLSEQDMKTSLFLIPVAFEGEAEFTEEPDYELHFGVREAQMTMIGSKLVCDDIPDGFTPAKAAGKKIMHYQTLKAPGGKRFIPLFTSYNQIIAIFGKNIRIGVICYETAREFVLKEKLDGIVVSPGSRDIIIPGKDLMQDTANCDVMTQIDDLKLSIEKGCVSTEETAGSILELDKCFQRCSGCRTCKRTRERSPEKYITDSGHAISEILVSINTEDYVDLINILSESYKKGTAKEQAHSLLPVLIDDYESRMQNELREQTNILRKTAGKMEWKVEFLPFNCGWVDGFIRKTEEWLRYVKPLIIVAAARETENSFVKESVKCLEELTSRALYNNDEAAYKLSSAFAVYFADMPSVMVWVKTDYKLAENHLNMMKRLFKKAK